MTSDLENLAPVGDLRVVTNGELQIMTIGLNVSYRILPNVEWLPWNPEDWPVADDESDDD